MIILLFKTPPSISTQALSCSSLCPSQHSPCRSSCALFAWRYGRVRKFLDKNFASLFSSQCFMSRCISPSQTHFLPQCLSGKCLVQGCSNHGDRPSTGQWAPSYWAFVASISRNFMEKPHKIVLNWCFKITQCGILGVTTLLCFNLSLPDQLFSHRLSCIPSI
jgi:hypothetical protein